MNDFMMGGGINILFDVAFAFVAVTIVVVIVKSISQWHKNNVSPRLTVTAKVTGRRVDVSRNVHAGGANLNGAQTTYATTSTDYYVTFEVQSGDRMEFCVDGREYGLLSEGDEGELSFQGTRYLSFVRK